MLKAKDFRNKAWADLHGNWFNMVVAALIVSAICGACGGVSWVGIGTIALLLITGPFELGSTILALNVVRKKEVKIETVFDGFKNFVPAFVLALINGILIALWSLLLIIPGIIKALSYGLSFHILADNPNMAPNEARKLSMQMMKGNKWRLFCLEFSFIGWILLSILTFGILMFWVTPYMNTAVAEFYQSLLPEAATVGGEPVQAEPVAEVYPELASETETVENTESTENND